MITMKRHRFVFVFLFVCAVELISGQECNVVPKCTCKLGDEYLPVQEATAGTEALAGAVGALGSSLLAGSGVGLWFFIKGRSSDNAVDFSRSDTTLSDESDVGRKGIRDPPGYERSRQDEHPAPDTPNNYRSGISRDLTNKKPAPIIQPGVDF